VKDRWILTSSAELVRKATQTRPPERYRFF
jgi:hypothetical protein